MRYYTFIKRLGIATCCVFILSNQSAAQNLVPNYSFEDITSCPESPYTSIVKAPPWFSPLNVLVDSQANSDIFHSCVTGEANDVPRNNWGGGGFQFAKGGESFIEIVTVYVSGISFREYAEVPLTNQLSSGNCYYAELYASLHNSCGHATNNLAMNFTDTVMDILDDGYLLHATPSITAYGNPVLTDTLKWMKISGLYVAHGGEQYLTIGNFKSDAETDTVQFVGGPDYDFAVYYVDAVSVIPVDSLTTLDLGGPDTSVVAGDSVYIGTLTSGMPEVQWYSSTGEAIAYGVPGIKVSPASDAYYVVEASVCGKLFRDTVSVVVKPVGMGEVNARNEFVIFPNPTNGTFNIKCPSGNWHLRIFDVHGREVYENDGINARASATLHVQPGIYFVTLREAGRGISVNRKLVVQ